MRLFRRARTVAQLGPVTPFRQRVMDRVAMTRIAADELPVSLEGSGIRFVGVFPSADAIEILFGDFDSVDTFLDRLFQGDEVKAGTMQDRASEGCITAAVGMGLPEPKKPGGLPSWGWEIHPTWEEGEQVWHISLAIPLDDALTTISILNSKRHGDSL